MICISDANIWIDLEWGSLVVEAFAADLSWVIPDIVLVEMETVDRERLLELGIEVCTLDGVQVERVAGFAERYRRPSEADLACLVLAQHQQAMLVTGDGALREAATTEGVQVHGLLWLLDRLVESGTVVPVRAANALQAIIHAGAWLPGKEVDVRMNRWLPK